MPLQEAGQFFAVVTGLAFPILSTEQELEKKRRVNAEVVEENFEVGGAIDLRSVRRFAASEKAQGKCSQ